MKVLPTFPGRVVHTATEGGLSLQVVDTATSRSLHFGTLSRQSSMRFDAPEALQLPYTRAIMSALLFCPRPRSALLIGLGGGSMAKFLFHHFPGCHIDAIEASPAVTAIARDYFALPRSERLQVHVTTAEDFLARPPAARYDLVLADAYLAHGTAVCMQRRAFYQACAARLREGEGVLAANLWRGRNTGFAEGLDALRRAFGRPPLRLPVGGRGNVIALATAAPLERRDLLALRPRARRLRHTLGLDLPAYLQTLSNSAGRWQQLLARI